MGEYIIKQWAETVSQITEKKIGCSPVEVFSFWVIPGLPHLPSLCLYVCFAFETIFVKKVNARHEHTFNFCSASSFVSMLTWERTVLQIPVFQRGGSVVPVKTAVGKSTGWMTDAPYGLRVALSTEVFGKFLPLYSGGLQRMWRHIKAGDPIYETGVSDVCLEIKVMSHCPACLPFLELFSRQRFYPEEMSFLHVTIGALRLVLITDVLKAHQAIDSLSQDHPYNPVS